MSPSRPIQNDEYEVSPAAHVTVGCVHDAETLWYVRPVAA
jgi:hypothetical protein